MDNQGTKFKKGQIPWNKGLVYNEELKAKLNLTGLHIGHPWNKGKTCPQFSGKNHPMFGKTHSDETRAKIALSKIGKPSPLRGIKRFDILKENNPSWKGGVTQLIRSIRTMAEYDNWRRKVYERDNFTCVWCDKKGGKLNADHIKPFSVILKENKILTLDNACDCLILWDIENGRTLCVECHKKTDTYGFKLRIKNI